MLVGRSSVDQSRITGESLPVEVSPGDEVFAGSITQAGVLEVRAERIGSESSYGLIIEAVRRAQSSEPPVQRLADRLAAALVYIALAGAAVTFLLTRDLTATISVVVVAGACGIAAGTPLAALAAIARIARGGAFVKDGAHLEALSTVDTIVFDKTGTLTTGEITVSGVHPAAGWAEEELLALAASAESPLRASARTRDHGACPRRRDRPADRGGLRLRGRARRQRRRPGPPRPCRQLRPPPGRPRDAARAGRAHRRAHRGRRPLCRIDPAVRCAAPMSHR